MVDRIRRDNCVGEGTLLIRADGNVAMGTGHVMRCLALAQAWQDSGGRSVFVMAENTPSLERRLQDEGIEVDRLAAAAGTTDDAEATGSIARRRKADWVVVDGYQFGAAYQLAIKTAGFKLLFLDDNVHAAPYSADLVLNQNMHATPNLYAQRDPSTQLLLGPRYAMLRREFRPWRNWQREIPTVAQKVLVTMGGSDPDNLTARVIEAIQTLSNPNLEATILVGGSNPHLRSTEELIRNQKLPMRLLIDPGNVSEWMTWADVAVAGAGTTFWEMCFLGLPSLLLVLAPNQESVAGMAGRMGIACNLGKQIEVEASTITEKLATLIHSETCRRKQSGNGRKLVDGRGAERVVAFLSDLKLRRTVDSDCEIFWEWANDPGARAASFRNKAISWEHHTQWFRAKLVDPKAILYTVTNKSGLPMGEVRYQVDGERAVLSIGLDAQFRGCGWGQKILAIATERFFQDSKVEFIDAYVKPTNKPSLNLFAGAGFRRFPPAVIEGQDAIHFVLNRSAAV